MKVGRDFALRSLRQRVPSAASCPGRLHCASGLDHRGAGRQDRRLETPAWRVLETSHPPTYYLPRKAFADRVLRETSGSSWCEWKGQATYYDLVTTTRVAAQAAWSYLHPSPGFEPIADAVAVMAALVDRCTVNGEQVVPQPGGFYGGWITSWIVGPVKGVPGSMEW